MMRFRSLHFRMMLLFCAVVGTSGDGHDYLADAVRRGAAAALVARPVSLGIPCVVVRDSRVAAALAAAAWFGRPAEGLRFGGVTGTNGKSTTVALIRHLLSTGGTVGCVGTLGAFDGAGAPAGPEISLTTPGAVQLQAGLAAPRGRGGTNPQRAVRGRVARQGSAGGPWTPAPLVQGGGRGWGAQAVQGRSGGWGGRSGWSRHWARARGCC